MMKHSLHFGILLALFSFLLEKLAGKTDRLLAAVARASVAAPSAGSPVPPSPRPSPGRGAASAPAAAG